MGQGRGRGAAQPIAAAHAAELRGRRLLLAARPANEGVDLLHCASAALEKAPCVKCQATINMTSCVSATAILSDALSRPAPRPASRAPRLCRWLPKARLIVLGNVTFSFTLCLYHL